MNVSSKLLAMLACPSSQQALQLSEGHLQNSAGNYSYPLVNDIPWLLPQAQHSLIDWSIKLNHFHQVLQSEIQTLNHELNAAPVASQQRLQQLLIAKEKFLRTVFDLMAPVVRHPLAQKPLYDALTETAPNTQNLLSYEANLYRDWVWGEEENKLSVEIVCRQLQQTSPNNMLVLGAGAGRLAFDLHQQLKPALTVATDINPLLLLAAQRIINGEGLSIYEFPGEPVSSQYSAVEHHISAVNNPDDNFQLVFADATKPAFVQGAFDTLITPWLIDIQPLELGRFLRQLNQYLHKGQQWINFGSLVFNQGRDAHCYAIDEVKVIAEEQGFELDEISEDTIPYLKSPYNAGHRVERVWSWRAIKTRDVKPLAETDLRNTPDWLIDTSVAIPKLDCFKQFSLHHRIYAQVSAEVDGRTSLNRIANKFAKQQKADPEESKRLLNKLFSDIYYQNT